jgi:putative NADPH-quinone reductase
MKVLVILAHPDTKSFNFAIAQTAIKTLHKSGHEVIFHDLYREDFPAIIPASEIRRGAVLPQVIKTHCDEIAEADGIVIVHPNWWGQPPAILKGWIDRVLRPGVAYKFEEGNCGDGALVGLLKADTVLVLNTSDTPAEREASLYGDPLEALWKNNMLVSCGVKNYHRRNFGVIITSTLEQRQKWLLEAGETVEKYFPAV